MAGEIKILEKQINEGKGPVEVNSDVLIAIDHVRRIGNFGAHMNKDINLILDVEPNKAEALIGLNELLFKEWYFSRHNRENNLKELENIVSRKDQMKTKPKSLNHL